MGHPESGTGAFYYLFHYTMEFMKRTLLTVRKEVEANLGVSCQEAG